MNYIVTVGQLIEALKEHDPDAMIGVSVFGHRWTYNDLHSHGPLLVTTRTVKYAFDEQEEIVFIQA